MPDQDAGQRRDPRPRRSARVHGRARLPGKLSRALCHRQSVSPEGLDRQIAGVLFPHGHWQDGRFHDAGEKAVRKQLVEGAERFEVGGRSPLQSLCVQLARMGCVVFQYDMVGYADSKQISFDLAHRYTQRRPRNGDAPRTGASSARRPSCICRTIMGLQTYNSIRALDWLRDAARRRSRSASA